MRVDVVVLGAGAAGLACAADLVAAGREPLVLEARSRIGGRVHTVHERGIAPPIELGAEFVHGRPQELLRIARAAGLGLCASDGEVWRSVGGRPQRVDSLTSQLAAILARMRVAPDTSVARALARTKGPAAARRLALAFVEGFDAAPPDEASARWVARAQSDSGSAADHVMRFAAGYDGVIAWLRARLGEGGDDAGGRLRTCAIVRRVEWRRGRVRVRCVSPLGAELEPIEAPQAVVALPLGVLQAGPEAPGAVTFDPPLPARTRRALSLLAMGSVLRLTLRFRQPFWRIPALSFLHAPDQPVPTWWTVRPFDDVRLVGWAGGRAAEALLALGQARALEGAVASLASALRVPRAAVEGQLAGWWAHDWSADPFARGAYAYARVGGADAWRTLAAPVEGTLVLAGEAVADASDAGTAHGAIASGRRAARALLGHRLLARVDARAGGRRRGRRGARP